MYNWLPLLPIEWYLTPSTHKVAQFWRDLLILWGMHYVVLHYQFHNKRTYNFLNGIYPRTQEIPLTMNFYVHSLIYLNAYPIIDDHANGCHWKGYIYIYVRIIIYQIYNYRSKIHAYHLKQYAIICLPILILIICDIFLLMYLYYILFLIVVCPLSTYFEDREVLEYTAIILLSELNKMQPW